MSSSSNLDGSPPRPRTAVRLAYLVSHPIQYQAPLLRRIAAEPGIELTVFFGSDFSVKGYRDEGFGVDVTWDIPLLDGYRHEFLPVLRDKGTEGVFTPISHGLVTRLTNADGSARFDALWVHGYATVNQMHGLLAAKALGIPVLVRSDSSLRDRPRGGAKLLAKKAFFAGLRSLVAGVLVTGTMNREYWQHYMGEDFPLFLLPYAVDNAWWQARCHEAAATRSELQTELGLDPKRPVILFASKMQTRKHCDDLIEAYARLAPAPGTEPEPYLVLVGDGEERAALEAQAAATGLSSIRFCGFRNQSELPRFFDLADVFVLPSRHEPWGLIVNEIMNAACPVIITDDCGCHPDLVTDGVEGFVYPVRDIDALEQALRLTFATPQTATEMGQRALERIENWSFEQDIVGLKQALQHVARKRLAGVDAATSSGDQA
ncbi:glycosyltransferase family 4 protein [Granulicella tundricola]|uniref:Glycosyl transferase group 1 n=1 Tax=Granulicella tundricola (strain ATCC BAA-1859 / DSM 23138 / MP5ACTX9) TaxID=1198114 RepID=E8WVF4_GRATM|nr:glycosyltransferase family 4 protein [Granulicella tundricola]ADW68402.1 glycosyl transferase group 1 [Granulicella tundricola MP5ACTX9]